MGWSIEGSLVWGDKHGHGEWRKRFVKAHGEGGHDGEKEVAMGRRRS